MTSALLLLLPVALAPAGTGSTPATFVDESFVDADWTTNSILVGPGSAVGTGLQVDSGNPAPARRVSHDFVGGGGFTSIYQQHLLTTAVYDPAVDGPIDDLRFTLDYRAVEVTQAFRPALEQDGRLYVASGAGATAFSADWSTLGPKLIDASNFAERLPDGSSAGLSQPDFSVAGAPITFGFETSNTTTGSFTYAAEYDNLRIEVNCLASASVVRLGSPPNPNVFLSGTTEGPVVGQTWTPFIDHASFVPGATIDFAGYSLDPANVITISGTVLCGDVLDCKSTLPGVPFAFDIPDEPALIGVDLCFQGASFDPLDGLHLTNALDVTIGCY